MIAIGELHEELSRARRAGWQVVHGRVLEDLPHGIASYRTPSSDAAWPAELGGAVLARLDTEETAPWSRPLLERVDLGRDFFIGDGSGEALVRVGAGGHVHPDIELHLEAPFVELPAQAEAEKDDEGDLRRTTYLRVVRTGDDVYVWGRPALRYAPQMESAGYRDGALTVEFSPESVMHIYDAPAWRRASAWRALPWYRKLSLLVRNR